MTTDIPRGVEVLVKKASVDPTFRELLLEKRAGAAETIGLELTPAEVMMLNTIRAEQLEAIIARTTVEPKHRLVFLGSVAAAMLIAIGSMAGCGDESGRDHVTKGIAPDRPRERKNPENKGDVSTRKQPKPKWFVSAGLSAPVEDEDNTEKKGEKE